MRPDPDCRLCRLCEGRTQVVYPDGDPSSGIVLVGEGPGENEDLEGKPFIGRSGKILADMMAAAGFSRSDVVITNTVKCRPPGNRDPTREEMAACRQFLESEVSGARLVVGLGKNACRDIMGYDGPMAEVANRVFEVDIGGTTVRFMPTYHPAGTIYSKEAREKLAEAMRIVGFELGPRYRARGVLIDAGCSVSQENLEGFSKFISELRSGGIVFRLMIDDDLNRGSYVASELRSKGLDIADGEVVTSVDLLVRLLNMSFSGRSVMPVCSDGMSSAIASAGIRIDADSPDIVVLAYDPGLSYASFNEIFHRMSSGSRLVTVSPGRLHGAGGTGIGAFSKTLMSMCQTSESIVEWPSVQAVSVVLEDMGVSPADALAVSGDPSFGPFSVHGSEVRTAFVSFGSDGVCPEDRRIPVDRLRISPPVEPSAVVLSLFKYT